MRIICISPLFAKIQSQPNVMPHTPTVPKPGRYRGCDLSIPTYSPPSPGTACPEATQCTPYTRLMRMPIKQKMSEKGMFMVHDGDERPHIHSCLD
jgi:hypothetical protein